MFAWATAEAIVLPIVPEFLLLALVIEGRNNFWRLWLASALGSALGIAVLFLLVYLWPEGGAALLTHLPFIGEARMSRVEGYLRDYGLMAFFLQPWTGIDYKFFGIVGATHGMAPWLVIPVAALARGLRMLIASGVACLAGRWFARYCRNLFLPLVLGYLAAFGWFWYLVQLAR
jgi:membrane protein YqaA with SNARE-associated domain